MTAREEILRTLQRTVGGVPPTSSSEAKPARTTPPSSAAFRHLLESVGGTVSAVPDVDAAAREVERLLADAGAESLVVSDGSLTCAVADRLRDVDIVRTPTRDRLFRADAGLSDAQWGICETGTLVLDGGQEAHRLTSLVPGYHIALLSTGHLLATFGEALAAVAHQGLSRTVTFITGPSRTADIELTLVVGVHGPKRLHVILLEDKTP